ncbi:class I SAM-dependent methyltransferase [Fulvivirga sedimenti]|uniref:Class I SAM-dependent methyltransferase n=1 Tax=Fulvivirga sedimenti TaxID=2879465 RepID=A0A9X1HV94_9BACT|nr:class I SAM-dependent methyltransferase [Fulvivirga sedimenti]MCA6078570.1 class I SAM-dependent methyltransferase [Fulvivirga sedimenti]
MTYQELNNELGNMDLYLLDQVLKGSFAGKKKLLDAGCGEGRNSRYFIQNGYEVNGLDIDPMAVKFARMTFQKFSNVTFREGTLTDLPYPDQYFDGCICSAVLHFAENRDMFTQMWNELYRVLKTGGILFVRMSATIGLGDNRDARFLYSLTQDDLDMISEKYEWAEPFKTVLVHDRSMSVLVLKRKA